MEVSDEKLQELVLAIANEVDYDIYKERFLENEDETDLLVGMAKDILEIE
jgi:hypothetical protein